MTSWHAYPKIWGLGHAAVANLLQGPVLVQEKVDGSQLSFGVFDGKVRFRSKGVQYDGLEDAKGMFAPAMQYVLGIVDKLTEGWTYRCEFVPRPCSNALTYDRAARNTLILYDINFGEEAYLAYHRVEYEAGRLGIDCIPLIAQAQDGSTYTKADFDGWLQTKPLLGGPMIEGIVIKNYTQFGADKKVLMGKYVSETFKEVHKERWNQDKATKGTALQRLEAMYKTEARWLKAVQHLREAGTLLEAPQDIGNLMQEVRRDLVEEESEQIKELLWKDFQKDLLARVTRGLPEWYKQTLVQKQFTAPPSGG